MHLPSPLTIGTIALGFAATSLAVPVSHINAESGLAQMEHKRPHLPKTHAKGRPLQPYANHTRSEDRHHCLPQPHRHQQNATELKLLIESIAKAKADKHIHRRSNETNPGFEKMENALGLFPFFKFIKDIIDKNVTDEAQFAAFIKSEFGHVETHVPVLNETDSGNSTHEDEAAKVESDTPHLNWIEMLRSISLYPDNLFSGTGANTTEHVDAIAASEEDEGEEDEDENKDAPEISLSSLFSDKRFSKYASGPRKTHRSSASPR